MSEAYNFTSSGEGAYNFEARNLFHFVDADSNIVPIYADAEAHSAKVAGQLAVARKSALSKRATFNGCTSSQQSLLLSAASAAQSYVAGSLSYVTPLIVLCEGKILNSNNVAQILEGSHNFDYPSYHMVWNVHNGSPQYPRDSLYEHERKYIFIIYI